MAKPILIANWKNHPGSLKEAENILSKISRNRRSYEKINLFIAPPHPYLAAVSSRTGSLFKLACQDMPALVKETSTGSVMPDILKSFGVRLSIIGHSEVRAQGETSEIVSQKVATALSAGIAPLVCIGEKERDRDGEQFGFLRDEIGRSLSSLKDGDAQKLVLAYEPIWAVGKDALGVIEPGDLSQTVIFIKRVLADIFGREMADKIPILYGGSVDSSNTRELVHNTGVRGLLVGRASLDASSLKTIAESLIEKE